MSDEESEDDFELSEIYQRCLREACDNFSQYASLGYEWWTKVTLTTGHHLQMLRRHKKKFDQLIDLPDSWPLARILVPL